MQNTWLWIVVVVVVLVGGFMWWQSTQSADTSVNLTPTTDEVVPTVQPTDTNTSSTDTVTTQTDSSDTSGASTATSATVTYTASGFSPATVTIKKGGKVTFEDKRNGSMWIGSGPHPGHAGYDGSSRTEHCAPGYTGPAPFDQCSPGTTYTFTFDKAGTFPYHDHMNSSAFGKVVVE